MAQLIKSLSVLLALFCVGASGAKKDLSDHCKDLSKLMATNAAVYTDPAEAFKQAKGHLKPIFNFGFDSRAKLANAWEAVLKEEPCNSRSGENVWIILDCEPHETKELATLDEAVKKYANRCLTPEFWDQQLEDAVGQEDMSGLTRFLSNRFISKYRKYNPQDTKVFFGSDGGPSCCHAMRSLEALMDSVELVPNEKDLDKVLFSDSDDLVVSLKERLIEPCHNYQHLLGPLLMNAKRVSSLYEAGEQAYIDRLSRDFQKAIFRYEYCNSLIHPERRNLS